MERKAHVLKLQLVCLQNQQNTMHPCRSNSYSLSQQDGIPQLKKQRSEVSREARPAHRMFWCIVYMCCLSSLFLLSPPLQERKNPFLQAPTSTGLGQQLPQWQRGQEEFSEPQRPFKFFLKTWGWSRKVLWRQNMHFLLGWSGVILITLLQFSR